jgi:hypothetical protein
VRRLAVLFFAASCAARPPPPPAPELPPAPTAEPAPPPAKETHEARARGFVEEVTQHRFEVAARRFDAEMLEALPAPALADLWRKIEEASGPFLAVEAAESTVEEELRVVRVTCRFGHLRKVLRVVLDDAGAVIGFYVGPVPADLEEQARALVDRLARGDYPAVAAGFDPLVSTALPPAKLRALWAEAQRKTGAFTEIDAALLVPGEGFWSVLVSCKHKKGPLVVKVVYDLEDRVAGLFFVPGDALALWKPPPYARLEAMVERDITVGISPALAGALTLPAGPGPHPVVILVHGSGPIDADGTLGPNKIFKDLAYGLAAGGIAAVRYVKRTRAVPAPVNSVKEEVLDAARAAVALARSTAGLDPARVVVAGHSQGGFLAPRIAAEILGIAGLVLLAAPSRPLQDSVVDQYAYFARLDPGGEETKRLLAAARAFKLRVEDPLLRPDDRVDLPGGGAERGAYFLSLRGYEPTAVAAGLRVPMLLVQGDRDYQVTAADLSGWTRALGGKAAVKRYPRLNHFLMPGSGTPRPGEYMTPSHVAEEVVADVAAFVKGL